MSESPSSRRSPAASSRGPATRSPPPSARSSSPAAKVIVYEQAVRFLGDHLDGDRYYRTTRPGHNLDRARNQVRLLESLEAVIGPPR